MKLPDFDRDFIIEWESEHCECEGAYDDDHEYQEIIKAVRKNMDHVNTIHSDTLKRILKWKDTRERVKTHVDWKAYDTIYAPRFTLIASGFISDHHKLFILIWDKSELTKKLPVASGTLVNIHGKARGFGIPIASTVLHFMYPDTYPIIDIRTAETIYLSCRIKSPNRGDYRTYDSFRSVILELKKKTGCTLRQIDRALFAYHKEIIQPKMNGVCRTWLALGGHATAVNLTLDAPSTVRRMILDALKRDP